MIDFFVIGNPRSGTTLLRLMLTAHPEILIPPECGFIVWLMKYRTRVGIEPRTAYLDSFLDDILAARKFDTWGISDTDLRANLVDSDFDSYGALCRAVCRIYGEKQGKSFSLCGDKNNFYLVHVADIHALFPETKFIHIVRDGRDVACSYRAVMDLPKSSPYHPNLPVTIADIARQWKDNIQSIRDAFKDLPEGQRIEVRYEDLVSDPPSVMRRLCHFLGLQYSEMMIDYHHKNRLNSLEPDLTMAWKQKTLLPVDNCSASRYLADLSVSERESFEQIAGEQLRLYQYL